MQDAPEKNLDDRSSTNEADFIIELFRRLQDGERIYGLYLRDGTGPIGGLGYAPVTPDHGWLHGICLSPAYQRKGYGNRALMTLEQMLTDEGVSKVSAAYYADNDGVRRLFARNGFLTQGRITGDVTRNGQPVALECVSKYLIHEVVEPVCPSGVYSPSV